MRIRLINPKVSILKMHEQYIILFLPGIKMIADCTRISTNTSSDRFIFA